MIELFAGELRDNGRQSSKGNQLKFMRDNIWYKADYLGYEGLAEYTVSKLLHFSDLKQDEYVDYDTEQIRYSNSIFNGCKSNDFTDGWNLITLERFFKTNVGISLNTIIYSTEDHEMRLKKLVDKVEQATHIKDFGVYMSKLLTIDALFLNEDRHTHNIAIMTDGYGHFRTAPIFDNGACLLSDTTMDYPLNTDPIDMMASAGPKTFCESFDEQLEIAEKLYGTNIKFNYGYNEVESIIDQAEIYDEKIRKRVIEIVMQTRRKYQYLFS